MADKPLKDYVAPYARGVSSSIPQPTIEANNFESSLHFQQNQFGGGLNKDPNLHLENFSDNYRGEQMNRSLDEADDIIESVTLNHHQWATQRGNQSKTPGKYEVDILTLLTTQMEALNKRFDNMNVNKVNVISTSCDLCGDSSHTREMCQVGSLQAYIA
ncbi:uncharacterized protein LOC141812132 [Curcuma longa]|uniref:uncharacterized protein LOC141812132 n=1 Tax=Curcuma longa TaxID=136217 RepID=UPI003D9DE32B